MQFAVTLLKMSKLCACLYLDYYKKHCSIDLLNFWENPFITNSLLFLPFSREIRGDSCYLG